MVKDVVDKEDRGRHLVMFGISKDGGQSLDEKINLVLADIDEKPRFEAVRLGTKKKNNIRPVKVSLSSSTSAANFEEVKELEQVCESQNCICGS